MPKPTVKEKVEAHSWPFSVLCAMLERTFGKMDEEKVYLRARVFRFLASCLVLSNLVYIFESFFVPFESYQAVTAGLLVLTQINVLHGKRHLIAKYRRLTEETYSFIFNAETTLGTTVDETFLIKNSKNLWKCYLVFCVLAGFVAVEFFITPLFLESGHGSCYSGGKLSVSFPGIPCEGLLEYVVAFSYVFLTMGALSYCCVLLPMLRISVASITGGQCRLLCDFLELDWKYTNEREVSRRFKVCIELHQLLERQIMLLDEMFSDNLGLELFVSVCLLCLDCVEIVKANDRFEFVKFAALVIGSLAIVYDPCYMGNALNEKFTGISQSCYFTNWYELSPKHRVMLAFIIQRSQESRWISIMHMKMTHASHRTFKRLLEFSYSFTIMLLQIKAGKTGVY